MFLFLHSFRLFTSQFSEKPSHSLSLQLFVSEFELPSWVISIEITSSWRIHIIFFRYSTHKKTIAPKLPCMEKLKILRAKNHVTSPFLYQVNFSFLLLKVAFSSFQLHQKIILFQFINIFKPVHMRNYSETI